MKSWNQRGIWVLIFYLIFQSYYGVYPSESYPIYYMDELWVNVNHMSPHIDTEIPFSYYNFPFCEPQGGVEFSADSLGKFINGYRVENSPYRFKMYFNESDIFLCRVESLSRDKFNLLKMSIDEMYHVNLVLDNLPVIGFIQKKGTFLRRGGYLVGFKEHGVYYLFNHLKFNVLVHKYEEVESSKKLGYMVVGFEVIPCSVKHNVDFVKDLKMYNKYPSSIKCDPTMVAMPIEERQSIVFTYEVTFKESDINWVSRWDAYLKVGEPKDELFFIFNFIMVVTFVVGIEPLIFLWMVRRDFARYEELDKEAQVEIMKESSNWMLVLSDVFRTPSNPSLLCVMVGNGVHILGMAMVSAIFAALGFVSLVSRRTLLIGMLFFYILVNMVAGYVTVRLWRTINQKGWISIALKTTCFFSFSFSMLTFLNFIMWGIPNSVSFIVILVLVWFCISLPLTLVGGYFGAKTPFVQILVQTNEYPRNIPHQEEPALVVVSFVDTFLCSIIMFELIEGIPILTTSRVSYGIGFLFVVVFHIVVVCAEVSLGITYLYLRREDWAWWWKSFYAPSLFAGYISFFFFIVYPSDAIKSLSDIVFPSGLVILWWGYSLFMVLAIIMASGTIGFFSSFWFVYYLYDAYVLDQMKSKDEG